MPLYEAQDVTPELPSESGAPNALDAAADTANPARQSHLLAQLHDAICLPDGLDENEKQTRMEAAFACLEGLKPSNLAEGIVATQMIATHEAAMECFKLARSSGITGRARELNLRTAAKLLDTYARLFESFNGCQERAKAAAAEADEGLQILRIERVIIDPEHPNWDKDAKEYRSGPANEDADRSGNRC